MTAGAAGMSVKAKNTPKGSENASISYWTGDHKGAGHHDWKEEFMKKKR